MTPILKHRNGTTLHQIDGGFQYWGLWLRALNDQSIMRYSEQRHQGHTESSLRKYMASFDHKDNHLWGIEASNHGNLAGTITAYHDRANDIANVGILVWEQKKGYGYGAWDSVCDWLFTDGVRKIEAGCMSENTGMTKIFERTGMEIEGVRKDHFIFEGRPVDLILAARFR